MMNATTEKMFDSWECVIGIVLAVTMPRWAITRTLWSKTLRCVYIYCFLFLTVCLRKHTRSPFSEQTWSLEETVKKKKKVKIVPASASRTEDAAFSKASTNQNLAFTLRKTLKTNYGQTKGSPTRQVTLLSFTPKADAATAITTLETEETP